MLPFLQAAILSVLRKQNLPMFIEVCFAAGPSGIKSVIITDDSLHSVTKPNNVSLSVALRPKLGLAHGST